MDEVKDILASEPTRLGERRQVSVLFTDMVGYTAIVERLGEENALHFTRMIYEMLTGAVGEHGGTVRSFAGDSIMAVFGIPAGTGGCCAPGLPRSIVDPSRIRRSSRQHRGPV